MIDAHRAVIAVVAIGSRIDVVEAVRQRIVGQRLIQARDTSPRWDRCGWPESRCSETASRLPFGIQTQRIEDRATAREIPRRELPQSGPGAASNWPTAIAALRTTRRNTSLARAGRSKCRQTGFDGRWRGASRAPRRSCRRRWLHSERTRTGCHETSGCPALVTTSITPPPDCANSAGASAL